jgi:hypothetical protein
MLKCRRLLDELNIDNQLLREFLYKNLIDASIICVDDHLKLIEKQKSALIEIRRILKGE